MANTLENANRLEYKILVAMNRIKEPIGACAVCSALKTKDVVVSEASIGRMLRALTFQGLLVRVGFRGHVITAKGVERLNELAKVKKLGEKLNALINVSSIKGSSIIDILYARRALEREAAYLAAEKATQQDIDNLEKIIQAQYKGMERNENYADLSTAFHHEVLRIAGSKLLKDLYEFIGLSVAWQDFFIGTFKMYNQPLNVSHEKILNAIIAGDSRMASHLMGEHLTDVINNARKLGLDRVED